MRKAENEIQIDLSETLDRLVLVLAKSADLHKYKGALLLALSSYNWGATTLP